MLEKLLHSGKLLTPNALMAAWSQLKFHISEVTSPQCLRMSTHSDLNPGPVTREHRETEDGLKPGKRSVPPPFLNLRLIFVNAKNEGSSDGADRVVFHKSVAGVVLDADGSGSVVAWEKITINGKSTSFESALMICRQ
jgi:hypothetical protein